MSKIDINGDGKADFSISITQIITIAAMFASIIGSYYTLSNRITLLEDEVSKLNYNQKEYTWKAQRTLEEQVKNLEIETRAFMKDIEYLQRESDKKRR
jgi:hypothetical protein